MKDFYLEILHVDKNCGARYGYLHTLHGKVEFPMFMPVCTLATVKTMSPEEIKEVFGDLVPFDIEPDACTPEKSFCTIKRMLDKKIRSTISDRNLSKDENTDFHLLYNIIYQEKRGAKMFTYGGVVCNENVNVDSISLDNFDFIAQKDSDVVYKIDVPILTHRETLALNQILFDTDKEKKFIEAKIITEKELTEYKKIYKYCPSFHDVRI